MPLSFAHGAVRWLSTDVATTTYTVSGLSFQPKAIRFYWMGLNSAGVDAASQITNERRGVGFAADTSNRRCVGTFGLDNAGAMDTDSIAHNAAVAVTTDGAGAITGLLDLNSITSDGFTLIVDDQVPASITVFWEAWGGTDITTVTIGDIAEPAATGTQNYTATGFTASGTDQVVMLAGVQSTAAVNTGAVSDSGLYVGFTTGTASANNIVVLGNNDEGSASADCDGYGRAGECIAMITVAGGNPSARAVLSAWGTDLFTINWTNRATTSRRSIYMAIKGGSWSAGSYTIDGNSLSSTATVSGLSFTPKGLSTMGCMVAESAAGTAHAFDRISLGSGSSTSSRRAQGIWDVDAVTNQGINHVIEYDSVLAFPSNAGALVASYDINAMNSDGFQIIVDLAGGVASEWQGYLTFGDTPPPTYAPPRFQPRARFFRRSF